MSGLCPARALTRDLGWLRPAFPGWRGPRAIAKPQTRRENNETKANFLAGIFNLRGVSKPRVRTRFYQEGPVLSHSPLPP